MAADDKTEKATPKKKEDAAKEGNVLRSMEINSALAMLVAFGSLTIWGPKMWSTLYKDTQVRFRDLAEQGTANFTVDGSMLLFFDVLRVLFIVVMPIGLAMMVAGVLASVVQVKPKVQVSVIKPRFSKMNPISGAKQKFGPAALFELAKNVLKLLAVGVPATMLIWKRRGELLSLGDVEPIQAGLVALDLTMSVGMRVTGIYIAIAIIDYLYQKHRYEKNLKMTKHEVKQEMRQQDLAPEMKAAQRRRQREAARRRMLSDVPTADVVITNPTHYAIALKYDAELGAPQVVAKGVDLLALRIREIAEEANVVRVENRPLARELYAQVEVGHTIPGELFAAVAEVLAYVYRAEERKRAAGEAVRAAA
ncbi:MAG: flhB [Thermoleophilia bacterium]|nr:flhB [Thermoleophilia bacterium]MCZ4495747.1 flhB [Thermoleophilia bacterium]